MATSLWSIGARPVVLPSTASVPISMMTAVCIAIGTILARVVTMSSGPSKPRNKRKKDDNAHASHPAADVLPDDTGSVEKWTDEADAVLRPLD